MLRKGVIVALILSGCLHVLNAQAPDSSAVSGGLLASEDPDTLDKKQVYTTAADFYHLRTPVTDSFDYRIQQYDPTREQFIHYGHLGNLGSPHRSLYFEPYKSKGLAYGQNQFSLYRRSFGDFKFYDSKTPITEFDYSQGLLQLDGIMNARFGKSFDKGIKLSLDYRRVNQTGQYLQQRVKNTNLGVGLWIDSPGGRYDGLFYYGSNSAVQQNNGGILTYDTLEVLPDPMTVPVMLEEALTTNRERMVSVQNHFHLYPESDTADMPILIDVIHTAQFRNAFIKFADAEIEDGNDYYGDFLLDSRGMRQFIFSRSIDNRVDGQLRFKTSRGEEIAQHILRAGIQYRYSSVDEEPNQYSFNELFFNASGRLSITDRLSLRGDGYIQLLGQAGDFLVNGTLTYDIPDLGAFSAGISLYQRSPTLIEKRLYVSQQLMWDNDFDKPLFNDVKLRAELTRFKLIFEGNFRLLTNFIYYDQDRRPVQFQNSQDFWQISAAKLFEIGKFGALVKAVAQAAPDELALPGWVAEGGVFFQDRWFKDNMRVRFGVDFRVTESYRGVNFFPVTGQFHLDDNRDIPLYPALDIYLVMQVKTAFRAFVKMENFSSWFVDDQFFQVIDYPQYNGYFRFGLWLKLFN